MFKRYARKKLQLAQTALAARKAKDANRLARKALKLDQSLEDAWLILAATSEKGDCLDYLQRALKINPESTKARKGLEWASQKLQRDEPRAFLTGKTITAEEFFGKSSGIHGSDTKGIREAAHDKHNRPLKQVFQRWQLAVSMLLVIGITAVAILAPVISPMVEDEGPTYFKIACDKYRCVPEPPSGAFPLGTVKEFDVFHTLIWGTRQSLIFGLTTALITAGIGTLLGAIASYFGGWLDGFIMRICDAFLAFPIIAAVAMFAQVITLIAPESVFLTPEQLDAVPQDPGLIQRLVIHTDPILLALILFSWMPYTRIIHSQVLQIKQTEYVEAARAVGVRHRRIIWRHILPNSIPPAVVMATRDVGRLVVVQASLTFIGIGGSSAWATILNIGKDWIIGPGGNLFTRWWIYLPITMAVVFFGVSFGWLGDEINHWMNPKNA